jgi:hypothetical protein
MRLYSSWVTRIELRGHHRMCCVVDLLRCLHRLCCGWTFSESSLIGLYPPLLLTTVPGILVGMVGDLAYMPLTARRLLVARLYRRPDYRSTPLMHPPVSRMARAFHPNGVCLFHDFPTACKFFLCLEYPMVHSVLFLWQVYTVNEATIQGVMLTRGCY